MKLPYGEVAVVPVLGYSPGSFAKRLTLSPTGRHRPSKYFEMKHPSSKLDTKILGGHNNPGTIESISKARLARILHYPHHCILPCAWKTSRRI